MKVRRKQYYYHVTTKKWPDRIRLIPLTDKELRNSIRPFNEPPLARICVSPIIAGCLEATGHGSFSTIYVYRTERKVGATYTWKVHDAKITKERWIVKPTWFIKYAVITKRIAHLIESKAWKYTGTRRAVTATATILLQNEIIETQSRN